MGVTGFDEVLLTGIHWVFLGFTEFDWVKLDSTWFSWVLRGFTGLFRVLFFLFFLNILEIGEGFRGS